MKCLLLLCFFTLAYGVNPICELKPDPGVCDAYMPRYYYNPGTDKCSTFIYGGCGGNKNNFKTREECESTCSATKEYAETTCEQEFDPGPCNGFYPRYYYNKETRKCEEFIFGGCEGNDNNFDSEEGCLTTCGEGSTRY